MRFARFGALGLLLLALASCSRDPKRYVESGNKLYDRGKFRDASILYRSAIKADAKYGDAYFHLASCEMKLEHWQNAVYALRRAIELLPKDNPEWVTANIEYAEMLLSAVPNMKAAEQALTLDEVRKLRDAAVGKAPGSFESEKLVAEVILNEAIVLNQKGKSDEYRQKLDQALAAYQKAINLRPGDTKTMLAIAKTYLLQGKMGDAEQAYRNVIEKDKMLPGPYQDLFKLYVADHRLSDAETVLKQAIATFPDDSTLQYQLATFYFASKRTAEMDAVLAKLKARSKQDRDTFLRLGDYCVRIGKIDQAIGLYRDGMNADSGRRIEYQKRIIEALIRQGKADQAYQNDLELLKEHPDDADARGLKSAFMLERGQTDAAISELTSVVAARPNNFVARYNLGRAYVAKKQLASAAQQFEATLAITPDYTPARLALTQVALMRGEPDTALKLAQDSLKQNPGDGASILLEATAYVNKGQFDNARPLLEALVKENPNRPDPLAELAVLNMLEKRYKDAEELFRRAFQADPSNVRGLLGAAETRVRMNDPKGAVQLVADEVQKRPERIDLKRELANIELRVEQYDKAIADYQAVVERYSDKPGEQAEIYGRIGQSYAARGDLDKGIENYKKARQLDPANIFYVRRIADLLGEQGKSQEAVAVYHDAMKIDPNNPIVLNHVAYYMCEAGQNLDEALTLAQRARQQVPNFYDASDTIGWIYLKKNLSDSAAEIFRDLTSKVKDNPTYHYHYGMALAQKGDRSNALKEFHAALQNRPSKIEEARIKELVHKLS